MKKELPGLITKIAEKQSSEKVIKLTKPIDEQTQKAIGLRILEKMGFEQAKQCYHLSYGMVVRPDGKMSSRAGNSFTFLQLINLVIEEINQYLEKYKDESIINNVIL